MAIKIGAVLTMALCATSAAAASNQDTIVKGKAISSTATIQAIDATARTVTLKDQNGQEEMFTLGPSVERFSELKVGDSVKTTYYESVVLQVRKAGGTPGATSTSGAVTPGTGARPAGTMGVQDKMTVTVKSIDVDTPSITVTTSDGRTVTRKVEDRKNLEGVSPGDLVDITYTRAVLMSIEPGQ